MRVAATSTPFKPAPRAPATTHMRGSAVGTPGQPRGSDELCFFDGGVGLGYFQPGHFLWWGRPRCGVGGPTDDAQQPPDPFPPLGRPVGVLTHREVLDVFGCQHNVPVDRAQHAMRPHCYTCDCSQEPLCLFGVAGRHRCHPFADCRQQWFQGPQIPLAPVGRSPLFNHGLHFGCQRVHAGAL